MVSDVSLHHYTEEAMTALATQVDVMLKPVHRVSFKSR